MGAPATGGAITEYPGALSTVAAVLLSGPFSSAAPPGVDPQAFATAMAEDVLGVLDTLVDVAEAVVHTPQWAAVATAIGWPATVVVPLPEPGRGDGRGAVPAALAALHGRGYSRALLVAPDAPDLPALHLAKVLRALDSSAWAAAPALSGGMVALAARMEPPPAGPPDPGTDTDLDSAPPSGARLTLGWRRLRRPGDLSRLDRGLEGWEATRTLLSG